MSREFLLLVQETAFKTPAVTPTVWTTSTTYGLSNYQAAYIRLDGSNAFTMRPRPAGTVTVPYGGGVAIDAYKTSDKQELVGTLTCKLTVGLAPLLLSWAGVRINSGLTTPWTTTGYPAGDLASMSVYHAVTRSDNTIKRRVYLGTKVRSWTLNVSEDSTVVTLVLTLVASTPQGNTFDASSDPTAGTFPNPADNNLAIDPFVFINAGGTNFITFGGAVRTQFTELSVNVQNKIASKYYANRYLQILQLMGRKTTVGTKLLYPATGQDDRTNYETLASESMSIEINNGTHGFTMACNAQNVLDPLEDDLPLDNLYMQSSTGNNLWDATAGSDFTLAFS